MQTFNDVIWEYRRKVLNKHRFWLDLISKHRWLLIIPFIKHKNVHPFLADCEEYCWIDKPEDVLWGNGLAYDIALIATIKECNYLVKYYKGLQDCLLEKFPQYSKKEYDARNKI